MRSRAARRKGDTGGAAGAGLEADDPFYRLHVTEAPKLEALLDVDQLLTDLVLIPPALCVFVNTSWAPGAPSAAAAGLAGHQLRQLDQFPESRFLLPYPGRWTGGLCLTGKPPQVTGRALRCGIRASFPPAGEGDATIHSRGTVGASAAGLDAYRRRRTLDDVPEAYRLVGNEQRKAHGAGFALPTWALVAETLGHRS